MMSLLARDHKNPSSLTEQELSGYQQLADNVLMQEISLHDYTLGLGLFLHPDVLAKTLQSEGAMEGVQKALQDQSQHPDPHGLAQLQRRMQRYQRGLNQQVLIRALQDTTFSSSEDASSLASVFQQKRSFAWFRIPLIPEKATDYTPSDASIEEYYNTHPFVQPASMQVRYLRFPAKQFAPKAEPTQAELKQFFAENPGRFDTPKQYHITTFLLQDQPHENSKRLATATLLKNWVSADKQPAFSGKWLHYSQTDTRTLDHAVVEKSPIASLQKGQYWMEQNENGHPVIAKCTDITETKTCTLASCPTAVKKAWREDIARNTREQFTGNLKDSLLFAPDDLTSLARSHNLSPQTSPVFTQNTGEAIAQDDRFRQTAFSDSVKTSQAISDPVVLASGDVIVMQQAAYTPAGKQELDSVRATILENMRAEHSLKSQRQAIEQALQDLHTGTEAKLVAKRFSSTLEKTAPVDQRHTESLPAALTQAGFAVDAKKTGWEHAQLLPDYAAQSWLVFTLLDADYQESQVDSATSEQLHQLYQQLELSQVLGSL